MAAGWKSLLYVYSKKILMEFGLITHFANANEPPFKADAVALNNNYLSFGSFSFLEFEVNTVKKRTETIFLMQWTKNTVNNRKTKWKSH